MLDTSHHRLSKTIHQSTFFCEGKGGSEEGGDAVTGKKMLDGCQRMNIPAHARTAQNGLPQKRLEEDSC